MRKLVCLALVAALAGVALPAGRGVTAAAEDCGLTTLQGTIDYSARENGGVLKCGPGHKMVVRTRLARAKTTRASTRRHLLTFFTIADVQLADEESPLRAEWADKCGEDNPGKSAFRPHETMVPHLMNAHIRAANEIARVGGPKLKQDFSFAMALGDLADNNQYNELRWIIDISDGGKLVDPDSGADGYHGFQNADPQGAPSAPLTTPVEGKSIVDLANEPFWAIGWRQHGRRLPWYSLPGNHDVKVQGTMPNTREWREFANAYAQGSIKWTDLNPEQQNRACEGGFSDPEFYRSLAQNPGGAKIVPPDEKRRLLPRRAWAREHFNTVGIPRGHGYNRNLCRTRKGKLLSRLCYSWNQGIFHFIGLDSNPDGGLEDGNIDGAQFRWLRRELRANSRRFFSPQGKVRHNRKARNRLIIVFAHHPEEEMHNESGRHSRRGAALRQLLLRFPNVILFANGHTHKNKIWPRKNRAKGTGYWEVNTSAIADFPTQSRTIEIADNRDGTLSIFAVVFDAAAGPNPRTIDWVMDDPTDERTLGGAKVQINEDWLASAGREIMFYDPQQDLTAIGRPEDRNVELLVKRPFRLR